MEYNEKLNKRHDTSSVESEAGVVRVPYLEIENIMDFVSLHKMDNISPLFSFDFTLLFVTSNQLDKKVMHSGCSHFC